MEMETEKNKKILVTHNGSFHADDIFAAAALSLYLEGKREDFEIIRTRDPETIEKGDYVFDIGGIYDPEKNRFDHHQKGGAGKWEGGLPAQAGIEYAAFGLVWKKFGLGLAGSEEAKEIIDEKLVAPIDAGDNGLDLEEEESEHAISPYYIQHFFSSMRPTWREANISADEMFLKCAEVAKEILRREIIQAKDFLLAEERVAHIYRETKDKRLIILDQDYPHEYVLRNFPEPLFVVYPRTTYGTWGVKAVRDNPKTFKNRKNFPAHWGGLRDEELQNVTGVKDAVFCHRGLFLAVAKSKEGALALANLALKN